MSDVPRDKDILLPRSQRGPADPEVRARNAVTLAMARYKDGRINEIKSAGSGAGAAAPPKPLLTAAERAVMDGCQRRAMWQAVAGGAAFGGACAAYFKLFRRKNPVRRINYGAFAVATVTGFTWGGVSNTEPCLLELLSIPKSHSPLSEYCRKALEAEAPDSKLWAKVQANMKSGSWTAQKQMAAGGSTGGFWGGGIRHVDRAGDTWKREDLASEMDTLVSVEKEIMGDALAPGGGVVTDPTSPHEDVNHSGLRRDSSSSSWSFSQREDNSPSAHNVDTFDGVDRYCGSDGGGSDTFFNFETKNNIQVGSRDMDAGADASGNTGRNRSERYGQDDDYLNSADNRLSSKGIESRASRGSGYRGDYFSQNGRLQRDSRSQYNSPGHREQPRNQRALRIDEKYDRMMGGNDERELEFMSDPPKSTTWDDIRRRRREYQGPR